MTTDNTGQKVVIVLVAVCSLVAVVAIILAAVSMSKGSSGSPSINLNVNNGAALSGGSGSLSNGGGNNAERIWTVQVGGDWGAFQYMDDEGIIQGFHIDVVTEVCEAAGIQCRIMRDSDRNCVFSVPGQPPSGGIGIMDRYYDACAGWKATIERSQFFDFSLPFLNLEPIRFFVLSSGGQPFDVNKPTQYNIGFMDGWAGDEKCLARGGHTLDASHMKHYKSKQDAIDGLKSGEVSALHTDALNFRAWVNDGTIHAVDGYTIKCELSGQGMMTRKDNDFNSHWNRGFQKLRDSGRFKKLCDEGRIKHETETRKMSTCVD